MNENKYNLTDKELSELYEKGWRWMAMDRDDDIYVYNDKPIINLDVGEWVPETSFYSQLDKADCSTNHKWKYSLYEIKDPNAVELMLTSHKTNSVSQFEKYKSEVSELEEAIIKHSYENGDPKACIDEAIDVAKSVLKYAKTLSEEFGYDFSKELERNHYKNEKRGYYKTEA